MYDVNAYNKYESLPNFSYKIIEHLIKKTEAEILWKLLYYNDVDAYKKENLTKEQKAALIYKGTGQESDFSVFLDFTMDDAITDQKSFLRIYPASIYPVTRTTGICGINFEVLVHGKINHLSNYTTRIDTIIQTLIEVLNGVDIGGLGVLFFDGSTSSFDKVQLLGQKPYKGKILTMSVNIG